MKNIVTCTPKNVILNSKLRFQKKNKARCGTYLWDAAVRYDMSNNNGIILTFKNKITFY